MIGENPDADRDDASEGRARRRAARGADKLVDVVHQRHRLRILVHLTSALEADFRTLKTTLELTDGNLGRHLDILAAHNLIIVSKGFAGRRPRTTVSITDDGRTALHREIEALRDLLDSYDTVPSGSRSALASLPLDQLPFDTVPLTTSIDTELAADRAGDGRMVLDMRDSVAAAEMCAIESAQQFRPPQHGD